MREPKPSSTPDYLTLRKPSGEWKTVDLETFEQLEPLCRLFEGDTASDVCRTIEVISREKDPETPDNEAGEIRALIRADGLDGHIPVRHYFAVMFPQVAIGDSGNNKAARRSAEMLGFKLQDASNSELAKCSREAKERAKKVFEVETDLDLLEKYTNLFNEFSNLFHWSIIHSGVSSRAQKNIPEQEMRDRCIRIILLHNQINPVAKLDEKIIEAARRHQGVLRRKEQQDKESKECLDGNEGQLTTLYEVIEHYHGLQKKWRLSSKELKKKGFQETIKTAVVGLEDMHGETVLSGRGKEDAHTLVSSLVFLEGLAYKNNSIEEAQAQLAKMIMEQKEMIERISRYSSSLNGNLSPQLAEQIQNIHPLETAVEEIRKNWLSIRPFIEKKWPKDKSKATIAIEGVLFVPA